MSHDPHPGNLYEPVTLHRYLYANANPVMYTDPSGEFSSMTEALTVTSLLAETILISTLYTRISHNLSEGRDITTRQTDGL